MPIHTLPRKKRVIPSAISIVISVSLIACGGSSGNITADASSTPNPEPVFKNELSLIAGSIGSSGDIDGIGVAARFNGPRSLGIDRNDNIYIADTVNSTVRKMSPAGIVTTLAGKARIRETIDGKGENARFTAIDDITVDADGNVYVIDQGTSLGQATVRKISVDGTVTTLAGDSKRTILASDVKRQDGTGSAAVFGQLQGIALDANGNLYVSEYVNGEFTIRKISAPGTVSTLLVLPKMGTDIVVDKSGNLLVNILDDDEIIKISPSGATTRIPLPIAPAEFADVASLTLDKDNNLVALIHGADGRLVKVNVESGAATTVARYPGLIGTSGIVTDKAGSIVVALANQNIIQKITPEGNITTIAGAESVSGAADGDNSVAIFGSQLPSISRDQAGNLFVIDQSNFVVRKIDTAGKVSAFAGTASLRGIVNGTGQGARFNHPAGITLDTAGNAYVTDRSFEVIHVTSYINSSVRKISPAAEVTTLAGSASIGFADGVGSEAKFTNPFGIVADSSGNLYVADSGNCVVRKVSPTGTASTVAGTVCPNREPLESKDGTGTQAQFGRLDHITVDAAGNLYVKDLGANKLTIRKITPSGLVSTLAGGAFGNVDGKGSEARFSNGSGGITIDAAGNLYLADTNNDSLRKITPAGVVTTVVGGSVGIRLGTAPSLYQPMAVTFIGPNALAITSPHNVTKLTIQ